MEGYQSSVPGQQPARKTMMEVTYLLITTSFHCLLIECMHACSVMRGLIHAYIR